MLKRLAIMVVCVSMLAAVGCKKEAEKACCGTCSKDKAVAAEKSCCGTCSKDEAKKACPAECKKECCAKKTAE